MNSSYEDTLNKLMTRCLICDGQIIIKVKKKQLTNNCMKCKTIIEMYSNKYFNTFDYKLLNIKICLERSNNSKNFCFINYGKNYENVFEVFSEKDFHDWFKKFAENIIFI